MKHLHKREKQELERILSQNGKVHTPDLMNVLDAFLAEEGHQAPVDLHRRLKARGLRYELEFVEGTLELFCRYGFAQAKEFKGQGTRYEHLHLGQHHDHLICTRCGKVEEFVNPLIEDLQINAARNKGFVPLEHRLDVYGLCEGCARQPGQRLCLCDAEAGEFLCIRGLDGGDEMRRRMTDMGLNVGSEVEVLSSGGGPVVVVSKGSRLALGRGLSEKVLVEPVNKERKHGREGLRFYRKLHRLRSRSKED